MTEAAGFVDGDASVAETAGFADDDASVTEPAGFVCSLAGGVTSSLADEVMSSTSSAMIDVDEDDPICESAESREFRDTVVDFALFFMTDTFM